jgi:hypothetical protein
MTIVSACAHKDVYTPEVGAPGVKSVRGGIVYPIPPTNPVIRMRLVSLGIDKDKKVRVRMYFIRRKPATAGNFEYLDAAEQSLVLPRSNTLIHPSPTEGSFKNQARVQLNEQNRQAIEMVFPLDKKMGDEFPHFELHWKLHYVLGGKAVEETQVARFDRNIKQLTPSDGDFLYGGEYMFEGGNFAPDLGTPFEDF